MTDDQDAGLATIKLLDAVAALDNGLTEDGRDLILDALDLLIGWCGPHAFVVEETLRLRRFGPLPRG